MTWKERLRRAFEQAGHSPDLDVLEELAQHAAALYEQSRADGQSATEADESVQEQIATWVNDASRLRHRSRRPPAVEPPATSASRLVGLTHDVRYAFRILRARPGAAAAAIVTIALGIAATTTLFSVAYGVLVKPLPWPDSERLIAVTETRGGSAPRWGPALTNAAYLAWREHASTIEDIGAWAVQPMTLTGAGDPERIRVVRSTASLMRVLRARPAAGRLIEDADEATAPSQVVVLSHALWRHRFGGRDEAIGRTLQLDGRSHTIIGVLAPDFESPDREAQAWVPMRVAPATGNLLSMLRAIARLRPGVEPAQAAAEATARARFVPDTNLTTVAIFGNAGSVEISAVRLLDSITVEVRPAIRVFLASVALLLAAAIANVASLQLARATTRRREIAVRAALGAGSGRLARQTLVEGTIVGLLGGIAGLGFAALLHRGLPAVLPADFPRIHDVSISAAVAIFAMGLALVASAAMSLLPVLHARRLNLVESLTEDGGAPAGGGMRTRTARVRLAIMVGQVAIACVLLLGASLLGRSFLSLLSADRGFDPSHLLTARVPLPASRYTAGQRGELLSRLLERIHAAPGVSSAAFTTHLPLAGDGLASYAFKMPSHRGDGAVLDVQSAYHVVSPGYFSAMRMRLDGRAFDERDTVTSQPVVIVNRAFARAYLAAEPIGARLPIHRREKKVESEIVGVVDDVRQPAQAEPVRPEMYVPAAQSGPGGAVSLAVRTHGDPVALVPIVRSLAQEQDATLALESIATMEDRVLMSVQKPRLYAILLGAFALFALAITAVGLFGVLSYVVALRNREIGVRAALGATRLDILKLVLAQGAAVTLAGLVVGLLSGVLLSRSLAGLMYGVSTLDPLSLAVVCVILGLVAMVACVVPARRAASVNPVDVLRR